MIVTSVESLIHFLRAERRRQHRTETELARITGLSLTGLNRLEMRALKNGPSIGSTLRLLEALDCELIVRRKQDPNQSDDQRRARGYNPSGHKSNPRGPR